MVSGTLLVTGASDSTSGPDSSGRQAATIAGVINGPNLNEHVVYEQMPVDASQWPATQLSPVGDAPNNPGRVVLRTAGVTVRRLVAASAALVATSWMMNVAPAQQIRCATRVGRRRARTTVPSTAAPSGSARTGSSE